MQGVIVCIGAALSWMAFDVDMGAFVAVRHDLGASRFFTVAVRFPLFHDHRLIDCDRCFTESL